MTLVNRKQISLYQEAEAGLNSLVKQTAQVGVGLLGILLLTGGNPPALTVGLSVVGGIAFVARSEEKRLTKFYARQTQLIHNSVIASETKQSQHPNYTELRVVTLFYHKDDLDAGLAPGEFARVKGVGCIACIIIMIIIIFYVIMIFL